MTREEEIAKYWTPPPEFERTDTIYERQVMVNSSNNGETVTGHEKMTIGKWWTQGLGVMNFCMASIKAPEGLPLTDETTPIGSPFNLKDC